MLLRIAIEWSVRSRSDSLSGALIIQTLPAIYQIGEADGVNFIARELIDGLAHS
jgi:hypothetical protein